MKKRRIALLGIVTGILCACASGVTSSAAFDALIPRNLSGSFAAEPSIMPSGARIIPAQAHTAEQPALTTDAPNTANAYQIGDAGPAGGLIFYDKGNNADGWRYLEAARTDIPQRLQWAAERINTAGCRARAVGTGKSNTQAIMEEAALKGGGADWAAAACAGLEQNGYNDWFLPSSDELYFLYAHLHLYGRGSFRSEAYWSSTFSSAELGPDSIRAAYHDFSSGKQGFSHFSTEYRVRPVRQLAGPDGPENSAGTAHTRTDTITGVPPAAGTSAPEKKFKINQYTVMGGLVVAVALGYLVYTLVVGSGASASR